MNWETLKAELKRFKSCATGNPYEQLAAIHRMGWIMCRILKRWLDCPKSQRSRLWVVLWMDWTILLGGRWEVRIYDPKNLFRAAVGTSNHGLFGCLKSYDIWMEYLRWCGIDSALSQDGKAHIQQFAGLLRGDNKLISRWNVIWFAVVWTVWLARNSILFDGFPFDSALILDLIKLRAWKWLKSRHRGFSYPFHNWLQHPVQCIRCSWVCDGVFMYYMFLIVWCMCNVGW